MEKNFEYIWKKLLSEKRERTSDGKKNLDDGRNAFDNDYSRIVNSSHMRRLQDKAQVFPLKKGDFVRTRLTHSLEVSHFCYTLGKSLEKYLNINNPEDLGKLPGILSVSGLVHDFGNPPFGHFGESVISNFYKKYFEKLGWKDWENFQKIKTNIKNSSLKNEKKEWEIKLKNLFNKEYIFNLKTKKFTENSNSQIETENIHILTNEEIIDLILYDGNAQTFRILTKLQYLGKLGGYNLSYGTLSTIIKYPLSSKECFTKEDNHFKFGYFLSEKKIFNSIATEINSNLESKRNPLTFLLEASDDIAYSIADIEDGIKKKIVNTDFIYNEFKEILFKKYPTEKKFIEDSIKNPNFIEKDGYNDDKHFLIDLLNTLNKLKSKDKNCYSEFDDLRIQNFRIKVQHEMILKVIKKFKEVYEEIMTFNFNDNLLNKSEASILREISKKISIKIFNSKEIVDNEIIGNRILEYLLELFTNIVLSEERYDPTTIEGKIYNLISYNYRFIEKLNPYKIDFKEKFNNESENVEKYKNDHTYDRIRMVIDFISGMTDSYALNLYKKLKGI